MAWDSEAPTAEELNTKPKAVAWDTEPPRPEELGKKTLSGFGHNAFEDAKGIVSGVGTIIKGAAKMPGEMLDSAGEVGLGVPLSQTTISERYKTIGRGVVEGAKDIGRAIRHPIDYGYEKPISQALNVIPAVKGVAGAAELAGKAAPMVAAGADVAAHTMARRALGFTKRFLNTEGKAANATEAAHVALDEHYGVKVITPGATPEVMLERAKELQTRAGDAMGEVLKEESRGAKGAMPAGSPETFREGFLFQPKKAVRAISKLRPRSYGGKVLQGGDYTAQNAVIDEAIGTIQAHGDRPLPWGEANELKGHLQGLANYDTAKSKSVNSLRKSIGGVFRKSLDNQLTTVMEDSGRDIRPFLKAKRLWKAADDMTEGLQNRLSSEMGNKGLGLTDLLAATVSSVFGGVPGAIGTVLVKKALEKYGVTAGATGAAKVAAVLRATPELLGKYGDTLKSAAKSGMAKFNATHEALLKQPEYQTAVSKIEEVASAPLPEATAVTEPAPPAATVPVKAKPNPQSATKWAATRAEFEASAPARAEKEAALKATKIAVRPGAVPADTRISLNEFASDFANREGVPVKEASKWMAAYKRSPESAFQMIADYSSKTIKNQAAARKWRIDLRQQLAEDAKGVKVGGLSRKQVRGE